MKVKNKNCSSIKTKEKIRNAFVESLKEDGSLANISVTKLVKKADISRSTFYTHYESIYDIAKELQDETLNLIAIDDSDIKTIDDLDKYIHKVIKNLKETIEKWKKETDIIFVLDGHPPENVGHKFATKDKERYGTIKNVTDKGYYTN